MKKIRYYFIIVSFLLALWGAFLGLEKNAHSTDAFIGAFVMFISYFVIRYFDKKHKNKPV